MIDIEYDTDRDLVIDGTGDISTVSGEQNIRQQHVSAALIAADAVRTSLSDNNTKAEVEREMERELRKTDYVSEVTAEATMTRRREMRVTVETNVMQTEVTV